MIQNTQNAQKNSSLTGKLHSVIVVFKITRSLPEPEGFFNVNQTIKMKVAVVGATGLVGTKMLQVLAERNFPVDELIPVASERSVGKEMNSREKDIKW
jgi:hypothetical protein